MGDNFTLDTGEFASIFGLKPEEAPQLFSVWDDDETCLIDALELFAGLMIFSKSSLLEKVRCRLR